MTEDIGSDRHRNPSSAEIDIAKLKERYLQLKEDAADDRTVMAEVKFLLVGHIQNSDHRHAQLLATFNQHNLEDAVAHTKMHQIDMHLSATDERLEEHIASSKRDPVTFWTSIAAAGTAVGAILAAIYGNKP